jgi:CHAT domain
MRFVVYVKHSETPGHGWTVRICSGDMGGALVAEERTMNEIVDPRNRKRVFPSARRSGAGGEGNGATWNGQIPPLGDAADPAVLWEAYRQLVMRDTQQATIQAFGSYLFETLLGEAAWLEILKRAGDEPVELALAWAESEWALTRLPWEMLRHEGRYLATLRRPRVDISRLVLGASTTWENLQVMPRVLFVLGASLTDGQIRAGAEYMELLRHLGNHASGGEGEASLMLDIVLDANPARLREAMSRFDPSIVHFICHGDVRSTEKGFEGVLQMMPDQEGGPPEQKNAEQLVSMLTVSRPQPPPIVVLNACYTGAQPPAQRAAAPLAAEMVKRKVPIVVGMWGQVADRACRLFTWCFYEALLRSKSVTQAVAAGRRMAFEDGSDPAGADWAFPAIFLAENVPAVTLDQDAATQVGKLGSIALGYRRTARPPFCDRWEIIERGYRQLLHAGEKGPRVLAIKVALAEQGEFKYGKTRSLEEFCVKLVADGYLPCFARTDGGDPPSTPSEFALAIVGAIVTTRARFEQGGSSSYEVFKLQQMMRGQDVQLSSRVEEQLMLHPRRPTGVDLDGLDPQVLAAAIHQDLLDLNAAAREAAVQPRVVLLLDDVHRFGTAALDFLLRHLLIPECLAGPRNHIPVVVAFSGTGRQTELEANMRDLRDFLERSRVVVRPLPELYALPDPGTDRFPWNQFLIGQNPPLVAHLARSSEEVDKLFSFLYKKTYGAPSMLDNDNIYAVMEWWAEDGLLIKADDSELLHSWRNQ